VVVPWWWPVEAGGLPRSSADIGGLEGSPLGLRAAGMSVRAVADGLVVAHEGTARLADVRAGTSWCGEGHAAFSEVVDHSPRPGDVANAQTVLYTAADACDALADGIQDCQDRIGWCRDRIDSLCLSPDGELADDVRPLVEAIAADVDRARDDHRRHLSSALETFAALEAGTIYAQPPPGFWDRVGGAWSWGWGSTRDAWNGLFDEGAVFDRIDDLHNPWQAVQFWQQEQAAVWPGLWDGITEMWDGAVTMAAFAPGWFVVSPSWAQQRRDELADGVAASFDQARDDPRQFAWDTGLAVVDYDTFKDSPGRWAGQLIPSLAATAIPYAGPAVAVATRIAALASRLTRLLPLHRHTPHPSTGPLRTFEDRIVGRDEDGADVWEGQAYGRENWLEAHEALTPEEADALITYGGSGHTNINRFLQNPTDQWPPGLRTDLEDRIVHLDRALLRQPVTEWLQVVRAANLGEFPKPMDQLAAGDVVHAPHYLSTALRQSPTHADDSAQVHLHLEVPPGTPAFFMEGPGTVIPGLRPHMRQSELLLGRGLSYELLETPVLDANGIWQVHARILAPEPPGGP
jgi:hypothetical protein